MDTLRVGTVDYHTGGEPFRIVTDGLPPIPGRTVAERRENARASADAVPGSDPAIDRVRRMLCHEPRGHADMYGCFVVPPDDDGAHLGVLFWHKDGYSTACGHGTIALGEWAVRTGLVEAAPDGVTDVVIDVPSGRVTAQVSRRGGTTEHVTFANVPSYVIAQGVEVVTSRGPVRVDVSYGGAIYASLSASSVGLAVTPDHYGDLVAVGREIKHLLDATDLARHPSDPRLSGVYGTILVDDLGDTPAGPHQRNVTIFADGEADRSPCGSGTCARLALLVEQGRLADGQVLTHESIVGSTFTGWSAGVTTAEGRPAILPLVRGSAFPTGEHTFVLTDDDPLGTGFVLR